MTDHEFSIDYHNVVSLDSVYLDVDDLSNEFDGHNLVAKALDQIAAEEKQEKERIQKLEEENKMDDEKQEKDKTVK